MIRKISVVVLLVVTMSLTLASCGGSEKAQNITLRLANNHVEGYPTSVACDEFAKIVKEKTEGRITVETYHGAVLGEEKSVIEQVQIGGIDFARISIAIFSEFEDELNALQLPYLYRDDAHMWNVLNGEIGESFLNSEKMKAKGIVGLNWLSGGSRNFYNTKRVVATPEDLKGLRIRAQESSLMMELVSAMGADPIPMEFTDVYSALQTGVIDGAENNWPSYISTSHFEVAKYITIDEHTRVPEMIIASTKTMGKLSKEDQEIIKQAAKQSTIKQLELWSDFEKESIKKAEASGNTITYLDANQVKLFQESVAELNKTEGAKYLDVINAIAAVK